MLTIFTKLGIMLWAFKDRILKILLELLVWLDLTVGLIIAIPFYIFTGMPVPNAQVTISAVVGIYSVREYRWAKSCEEVIDFIFYPLQGPNHCQRMADKTNYQD